MEPGKTTVFRMLTGDTIPTSGSISCCGHLLNQNKHQCLSVVGYCPQHDPHIDLLTARESIQLMGRLRGFPGAQLKEETNKWLRVLDLEECANRRCGLYSGGNKRRLTIAQALIGNPAIVFLDEPTSAIDPEGRRQMWDILLQLKAAGQSIVLTSHSMDECEALCDRLAIMTQGQLRCIGSLQHLKSKFSQGHTIEIKLSQIANEDDIRNIKDSVERELKDIELKDEHQSILHYHLQSNDVTLGEIFSKMEKLKQNLPIILDFTVSQTSLEELFLSFARNQNQNINV